MEQNCYNFKHISIAADEILDYISKRRKHLIEPLKTRWKKFNAMCCGGIEPGCIYTIAGTSGSGKSSFLNEMETDLIKLNPKENVIILSFSFEMLSSRQVGRKLSSVLHQTTSDIYSAVKDIDDTLYNKIETEINNIKKLPIYYIDYASTVNDIGNIIEYFQKNLVKDKWLVIMLDHTLLVNGDDTSDERKIISQLEKLFIKVKKINKTSIIQLSQLNRNIEVLDRINSPTNHYPIRSDLSSSDSIFQGSDVIAVLSRPELLGITAYGVNKLPTVNKIYLHFLKVREGSPAILEFENDLKYNNLIEK